MTRAECCVNSRCPQVIPAQCGKTWPQAPAAGAFAGLRDSFVTALRFVFSGPAAVAMSVEQAKIRGRGEEGKRGRGEEGKRGRGEEGKRGRGEEGKRGRGEEGKRGRGEEGKRGRGEEGKRGRGEEGKRGRGEEGKRGLEGRFSLLGIKYVAPISNTDARRRDLGAVRTPERCRRESDRWLESDGERFSTGPNP
jgi:hypothetical protein